MVRTTTATTSTTQTTSNRNHSIYLLQGVVAVVLGLALLLVPVQTLFAFIIILGSYWLVRGLATLASLAIDSTDSGWKAFVGILGLIAGGLALMSPMVTGTTYFTYLIFAIGIQGVLSGITEFYYGADYNQTSLLLLGAVSILLGAALLLHPWVALGTLVMASGAIALVGGIIAVAAAVSSARRRSPVAA